MLLQIPAVLNREALARVRAILDEAEWADGRITAGTQSAQVKKNLQLPHESEPAQVARAIVLDALAKSALFMTGALPKHVYPPLFNRYEGAANAFGNHVDNAVRTHAGTGRNVRTDVSATLFLSDPDTYDGGELVIEDTFGTKSVKLRAGDLVIYPGSSLHRVEAVTRGARLASFFWIESMVRDAERRRLLYEMDMAILKLRETYGDIDAAVSLTGSYHNLLRMWAEV
jgi:PKHD-type hydroxylase